MTFRLLPILLKHMVYSEDSLFALEGLHEDASVPDKEESIKPRHHKARTVVALDHDAEADKSNHALSATY